MVATINVRITRRVITTSRDPQGRYSLVYREIPIKMFTREPSLRPVEIDVLIARDADSTVQKMRA